MRYTEGSQSVHPNSYHSAKYFWMYHSSLCNVLSVVETYNMGPTFCRTSYKIPNSHNWFCPLGLLSPRHLHFCIILISICCSSELICAILPACQLSHLSAVMCHKHSHTIAFIAPVVAAVTEIGAAYPIT